jgi:hypothetical protein
VGRDIWLWRLGYVAAGTFEVGDRIVSLDGSAGVVTEIEIETLDKPLTVYNLEVEGYHSYFVGYGGLLVHNGEYESNQNLSPDGAGRKGAFNKAKRDTGIPTSMSPDKVLPNYDKRGKIQPGKQYVFGDITIRDDSAEHTFPDGGSLNPHFNTPNGGHYFYK